MDHDLSWLCSGLGLDEGDILNLYLVGSRVYGTASPDADWDLVGVVKPTFFDTHSDNMIEKGL